MISNRAAHLLSTVLCGLMCGQSTLGLLYADQYRDPDWITASWFGNDWVTLLVAVPSLFGALSRAARSSVRALLLWCGVLGYAIYNYAFYLFGAALNAFFLLYVGAFVVAATALILVLAHLDAEGVAAAFPSAIPTRLIGGGLAGVAIALAALWIAMWAAYAFAGKPLPVEPEPFRLVAALDLSLMVPALLCGGVLLRRKSPWGYVVGSIASIQASLYLLVLSVNSVIAIRRGLAAAPGQLPIWASLTVFMMGLTLVLLSRCTQRRQ